jgi:tripartite-type tricarboxylate transporter receptor subunit TctC
MLVGYGVGTGNDLYMRLLARHIGKHIPGRPTIEPENMPGAGSMVMMNYLSNVAPHGGPVAYLARFQSTRATTSSSACRLLIRCQEDELWWQFSLTAHETITEPSKP